MTDENEYQVGGSHYISMSIQPWDAMEAWMTPEQFKGFLIGNVLKYIARAGKKDSEFMDYTKARHYLDKLVTFTRANPQEMGSAVSRWEDSEEASSLISAL
jgi:hypothetical protein